MKRILTLVMCFAFLGCDSGDKAVPVDGAVTLDGQPVGGEGDAVIRFDPADKVGNPGEDFVNAGKYSLKLVPGRYKVSILWNRKTGRTIKTGVAGPGSETAEVLAMVPRRYNSETKLTAEVTNDVAKNKIDFKLEGAKRK